MARPSHEVKYHDSTKTARFKLFKSVQHSPPVFPLRTIQGLPLFHRGGGEVLQRYFYCSCLDTRETEFQKKLTAAEASYGTQKQQHGNQRI